MSFSILQGVESRRRETTHEESNLHYHQWTFQELVPQQEQHLLDNRLPTPPHRPLRSNIRKRKHQVRPIPPKPGLDWERADSSISRLRQRAEPDRRLQPPHGRRRTTGPASIREKRRPTPESRPETASHTARFQRYIDERKERYNSALHGSERPSLRIARRNSALGHHLLCSRHCRCARPPKSSTSWHRNPEYPLHRLLHPWSHRHDPPHHRRLWCGEY